MSGGEPMKDLTDDVRRAARGLVRAPTYSLAVIATLALGVAAITTLFSLVSGVLLEPLPYPDPDRIVFVNEDNDRVDIPRGWASAPNYLEWRERASSFESLALFRGRSVSITTEVMPEYSYGALVAPEFFDVFGTEPVLGRRFTPEEMRPGAERVVVLGHGLWVRGFGADESLVGRSVRVDGEPHTVIGVMPPGFETHGDWVGRAVELWRPLVITDNVLGQGRSFHVAGRLAPGVGLEAARSEMSALQEGLRRERPDENAGWSVSLRPYREMIVGGVAPALWLLLATAGVVLVIACVNIAGLGLNRVFDRAGELATRLALGAGRGSLARLVLAECGVLAVVGGAIGVLLAAGLLGMVQATEPGRIPRLALAGIDSGVLLFSVVATSLTALVFGGVAALAAARSAPSGVLRRARSGSRGRRRYVRDALVTTQLTLSFGLLLTSGLLIHSFVRLQSADLGLRPRNVSAATVALSWDRVSSLADRTRFTTDVLEALRALPGVESVGMINSLPLSGSNAMQSIEIEDITEPGEEPVLAVRGISPGYLETLGIPVVAGRAFDRRDVDQPEAVLVNRTLARRYWPVSDAVGKRVRGAGEQDWLTVVGVVGDVRHYGPGEPPGPEVYTPYSDEYLTSKTFVVRWEEARRGNGGRIRETIAEVDPDQPVREVRTMDAWAARATDGPRFQALTASVAAALASALAAIGLFGVLAGLVRARTPELAVRVALGAPRGSVVYLVLARTIRLVASGVVGGAAIAFLLRDVLEGFLLGISVHDAGAMIGSTALFILIGLAAALLPARRATTVDTARVLREN